MSSAAINQMASEAGASLAGDRLDELKRTRPILVFDSISDGYDRAATLLPWVQTWARRQGVIVVPMFYNSGDGSQFHEAEFRSFCERLPPDTTHACIDREGVLFQSLRGREGAPGYRWGYDQLQFMLQTAHGLRPEIKWSIWGFPSLLHRFEQRHLDRLGCLYPHAYDRALSQDNPTRHNEQILHALRTFGQCDDLGPPVYATVRWRIPSNAYDQRENAALIPVEEWFDEQIKPAMLSANGIAVWGKGLRLLVTGMLQLYQPQEANWLDMEQALAYLSWQEAEYLSRLMRWMWGVSIPHLWPKPPRLDEDSTAE